MTRLQQIEEIFQGALQRDPAERDAYVRKLAGEMPSYNAKSRLYGRIIVKPPTQSTGPRERRPT